MSTETSTLGFVYRITSPSGKIYIGSTNSLSKRYSYYNSGASKNQVKIHRSILKYGWENHVFDIIWVGLAEERLKYEHIFGMIFNVLDKYKGLNCVLPGYDDIPKICSESTLEKMSEGLKGRKRDPESTRKTADKTRGIPRPEHSKYMKERFISGDLVPWNKGKKCPNISKALKNNPKLSSRKGLPGPTKGKKLPKLSEALYKAYKEGRKRSLKGCKNPGVSRALKGRKKPEHSERMKGRPSPTAKLLLNVVTGIFFYSLGEAAFSLNISERVLRKRMNGPKGNITDLIII